MPEYNPDYEEIQERIFSPLIADGREYDPWSGNRDDYQAYLDGLGEELSNSPYMANVIGARIDQDKSDGLSGDEQRFRMYGAMQGYLRESAHRDLGFKLKEEDAERLAKQIVDEWDIGFDEGTYAPNPEEPSEADNPYLSEWPTYYMMMLKPDAQGDWRDNIIHWAESP